MGSYEYVTIDGDDYVELPLRHNTIVNLVQRKNATATKTENADLCDYVIRELDQHDWANKFKESKFLLVNPIDVCLTFIFYRSGPLV